MADVGWVRAGPDCDAYTQQCALFSAHNTRASTVLVLRVMLCKSVHLFLKYGLVKLSWYDCYFRLSCLPSFLPLISPDTDPFLIRNLPLSRKKMQMCDNIMNNVCYKRGIMCTFSFHVPIDGDCAQGSRRTLRYWLVNPGWSQWSLRD